MLDTSARLLRLLSLLQVPREWTGAELAERLGVSPRTVRHDIGRLRDLGYPVGGTRGPAGGYRLKAGSATPPLLLDDEEAVAVAAGLRTAAGGAISGIEEASLRALAKLEQVLPARLRRRVNALQSFTVTVAPAIPVPLVDPAVLSLIATACRDRERLRFGYTTHDGDTADRDAEPYRLVNWGRRWYLVAWDTWRRDWRIFRVDRIKPKVPNGARFAPRTLPSDDLAGYVAGRVSAATWRYRARVTVFASAAAIAARIAPLAGTVTELDEGSCLLETGSDDPATLAAHLGLLGADFLVREPDELVAALRDLSERYARAAG